MQFFKFCISRIKAEPDKIFNINSCSKEDLLELCRCTTYTNGKSQKNLYETLAYDIEELRFIDEMGGSVVVSKFIPVGRKMLGDKWENEKFFSSISKVSPEYVRIIEKESEDAEYLALKEQYDKDMEFYMEHRNMMDHEPVRPYYNGYREAVITPAGRAFLDWAADMDF